ncbi:putative zinc-binding alcohol dehydrogenase [Trichoderma longibrachiatum]|uniref:alcohol dehydrogenase (NADP(+)) n=1 Tax=Trichoderma longibrachiatum ATCC 18648 TaxID=983965 RepID=A0A2T4CK37_TRILO|nr:GroES-like protein [Trichoderma longibrachiatum ATCC 18648]
MSTEYKFEGWMGDDVSSSEGKMVWREFEPKPWEETDVDIKVTHCGVCGSDVHVLRSGWGATEYPCLVGHEILGVAVRVGSKAENDIHVGDVVGVGAQSDACLGRDGPCAPCSAGLNQYCPKSVNTYNDRHRNNGKAYGGYALYHRAPSHFVFKIPSGLAPEFAAPLLCGGITVYSPLKYHGAGPGKKIGVVGIGGLGHFAVLFAKALKVDEVVGISRRENKRADAMSLGCDDYIATSDDADWVKKNQRRFDLIISTASSDDMPFNEYLALLAYGGTLVQVGVPEAPIPVKPFSLIAGRKSVTGSSIGSPNEIRDMFQLAADKQIKPWVEKRPMKDANQTLLDLEAGKPRFRYVLVNEW